MEARARLIQQVSITAGMTDRTGIRRYLRVTPEEPQTVLWVVPGDVVTYNIESNTQWNII